MLHGTHIHGDIYICYTHRVHMDLPPRPEAEQQAYFSATKHSIGIIAILFVRWSQASE